MALLKQSLFHRNTIFLGKNVNFQEKCKFFSGHFENLFKKGKRYSVTTSYKRSSKVSVQCYNSLTDDIISLFNFIFTDLHGYQIKPGLLGNVKIGQKRSFKGFSFYFSSVWELHNCNSVSFEIQLKRTQLKYRHSA